MHAITPDLDARHRPAEIIDADRSLISVNQVAETSEKYSLQRGAGDAT
ncbi:hypothetical protein [Brevundimonas sp.]|nr:hypothetical protein [Brevundimonas sp.]